MMSIHTAQRQCNQMEHITKTQMCSRNVAFRCAALRFHRTTYAKGAHPHAHTHSLIKSDCVRDYAFHRSAIRAEEEKVFCNRCTIVVVQYRYICVVLHLTNIIVTWVRTLQFNRRTNQLLAQPSGRHSNTFRRTECSHVSSTCCPHPPEMVFTDGLSPSGWRRQRIGIRAEPQASVTHSYRSDFD